MRWWYIALAFLSLVLFLTFLLTRVPEEEKAPTQKELFLPNNSQVPAPGGREPKKGTTEISGDLVSGRDISKNEYYSKVSVELDSGKRLSTEEFQFLLKAVGNQLPSKSEMKLLSAAELHHSPEPVLRAGQWLGLVAHAIENEKSLTQHSLTFYEKCVRESSYLDSVRALCLFNFRKYCRQLDLECKQELGTDRIRELANKLE